MAVKRWTLAVAALLAGFAAQAQDDTPTKPRLLFVMAHPDDEVFVAPAIARAVRKGQPVTVVFATSGDQGPGVTEMERGAALAELREGEASCSMAALGGPEVRFLRLGDGTLGVAAHHPGSSAQRFADALGPILAQGEFDMVFTWGPDGGYGHADHRMVSALTSQLVQAMGNERPALLFPGIRAGTLPPVPEMQAWAVTDPALLEIPIEYGPDDLAAATRAVGCHASQFDAATRAGMMALFDQSIWQGAVHFRWGLPERPSASDARSEPGPPPRS
jgi:N-acetyl-1-D-myo-inositol-2-amino-2-deoxy-alpha-D-glucopyranoside deacetylase